MSALFNVIDLISSATQTAVEDGVLAGGTTLAQRIRGITFAADEAGAAAEAALNNENPYVAMVALAVGFAAAAVTTPVLAPVLAASFAGALAVEGVSVTAATLNIVTTAVLDVGISNIAAEDATGIGKALLNVNNNASAVYNGTQAASAASIPVDQQNWGDGSIQNANYNNYDSSGNFTGSTSLTFNSDGSSVATNYVGPNGTGFLQSKIIGNPNGTSEVIIYNSDGSSTGTFYSGQNGTGTITAVDRENADGTSQITTYDANGNSITINYSGANGTGTQGSQTIIVASGSLSATVQIAGGTLNFPTVRTGAVGFYNQYVDVTYVGGNIYAHVSDPFTFIYDNDFYLGYPAGATIGTGSVPNTGSLLVTSGFGLLSGGYVTAEIPVSVEVGFLGTSVTTNVIANQNVYETALPVLSISGNSTFYHDFGVVHVGDMASMNVMISNAATASLSDSLVAEPGVASGPFSMSGSQEIIQAGGSQAVTVNLDTSRPGSFFGSGTIGVISHDSVLPDETLSPLALSLSANVYTYAAPTFTESDGIGTLVRTGTNWSINLGDIQLSASNEVLLIGVQNANQYYTDSLAGSFDVSPGSGFSVSGAGPFTDSAYISATVNESSVGQNAGTIVLHPLSQNYGGFSGVLPDETLTITDNVLCFLAGTLIRTLSDETPVERLTVGDMILTATGQPRPIVWIGVGRVLATRGRRNAATPVIVRKGALGPSQPHRDLRVTKGHSLYIDDVLIPAEFLVNHRSILWDDHAQEVTVYHVELETHDVLSANGVLAESYRDDGNRWLFQNANSGWRLPPKEPCAPVLTGGPIVDAIWRRLLDRAGLRPGFPLTEDADLHVLVDGRRQDGVRQREGVYAFYLPAERFAVHIASRAAAPAELGLARDPRLLGVAIRRIAIRQLGQHRVVGADDALLSKGFHAFEADNGFRWTDGDAVVPSDLLAGFIGPVELSIHIGMTARYIEEGTVLKVA